MIAIICVAITVGLVALLVTIHVFAERADTTTRMVKKAWTQHRDLMSGKQEAQHGDYSPINLDSDDVLKYATIDLPQLLDIHWSTQKLVALNEGHICARCGKYATELHYSSDSISSYIWNSYAKPDTCQTCVHAQYQKEVQRYLDLDPYIEARWHAENQYKSLQVLHLQG